MKVITVSLPDHLVDQLSEFSARLGYSRSQVVARMLEDSLRFFGPPEHADFLPRVNPNRRQLTRDVWLEIVEKVESSEEFLRAQREMRL